MRVLAKLVAPITRAFYPRGTQRLLKIIFSPEKLKIKDVMKYDRNLSINIDTSSYVEWELFFRGYYEKNVIDVIKKIFRDGFVAIDAGANIGTHTLIMAKLAGSSGRIFAFEPLPEARGKLNQNILLNHLSNIEVMPLALSDKSGKMSLFSYSEKMIDQGTASLYGLPHLQKTVIEVPVSTVDAIVKEKNLGVWIL